MLPSVDARDRFTLLLGGVVVYLGLAGLVASGVVAGLDTAALEALAALHESPLDAVMAAISDLGTSNALSFFTMFAVGYLVWAGAPRSAAFVGLAYVLSGIITALLKRAATRPRPAASYQVTLVMPDVHGVVWAAVVVIAVLVLWRTRWRWAAILGSGLYAIATWYGQGQTTTPGFDSFPSGHALRTLVLVTSAVYVLPQLRRPGTMLTLGLVLFAIGLSRVYLGLHHPSDVIAGWGAAVALVAGLSLFPFVPESDVARPSPRAGPGAGWARGEARWPGPPV